MKHIQTTKTQREISAHIIYMLKLKPIILSRLDWTQNRNKPIFLLQHNFQNATFLVYGYLNILKSNNYKILLLDDVTFVWYSERDARIRVYKNVTKVLDWRKIVFFLLLHFFFFSFLFIYARWIRVLFFLKQTNQPSKQRRSTTIIIMIAQEFDTKE